MRPGNNSRRPRGRPNRKQHVSPRAQTFDSHGPDVRIRGNAPQVYEKYLSLARDAHSSGDRIASESYYQFAEHYFRIMNDSTDPQRPGQPPRTQEPPRAQPHEQQPVADQVQPRLDQEQPHVEWPARGDGMNGAPAEQPTVAQPPAKIAETPVADGEALGEEDSTRPRRTEKPRQRSRRRASNGAADKADKSETVASEESASPAPDQDPKDEAKPLD